VEELKERRTRFSQGRADDQRDTRGKNVTSRTCCGLRRTLRSGPGSLLFLVYHRLPGAYDLFGEFGDVFHGMRAKFPNGEAGFAFLWQ
jgi:hypothetical protein